MPLRRREAANDPGEQGYLMGGVLNGDTWRSEVCAVEGPPAATDTTHAEAGGDAELGLGSGGLLLGIHSANGYCQSAVQV